MNLFETIVIYIYSYNFLKKIFVDRNKLVKDAIHTQFIYNFNIIISVFATNLFTILYGKNFQKKCILKPIKTYNYIYIKV